MSAPPTLRAYLAGNHQRLEALMVVVLAECAAGGTELRRAWEAFHARATLQMDAEDRVLLPHLGPKNPREVRALSSEHRHLRARMTRLAEAARDGSLRADAAALIMDEVRAHSHHEEEVAHLYVDAMEPIDVRRSLVEALARLVG